jgi:hypothetical protein
VKEQSSFTLLTQKVAESPLVYTKKLSNGTEIKLTVPINYDMLLPDTSCQFFNQKITVNYLILL